jgi:membrane protein DedA with SNARE-associated domain
MPMKWYDVVGMLIWYGYNIFCLKKVVGYLRHPDSDRRFDFIILLLGLLLVLWLVLWVTTMNGEGRWNLGN